MASWRVASSYSRGRSSLDNSERQATLALSLLTLCSFRGREKLGESIRENNRTVSNITINRVTERAEVNEIEIACL